MDCSDDNSCTWLDYADSFILESFNAMISIGGVILSIAILSVGVNIGVSMIRRAGRES